ncbi:MAG TPA: hypothetical protein VFP04_04290, partial [Nitrospira sp.]|nr:hypothetical protein [Nitrospira sp.]
EVRAVEGETCQQIDTKVIVLPENPLDILAGQASLYACGGLMDHVFVLGERIVPVSFKQGS